LQCVAVRCSVLQCVAVHCSAWQCPRTEELRLTMFGSPDQTGFPLVQVSDRHSRVLVWKLEFFCGDSRENLFEMYGDTRELFFRDTGSCNVFKSDLLRSWVAVRCSVLQCVARGCIWLSGVAGCWRGFEVVLLMCSLDIEGSFRALLGSFAKETYNFKEPTRSCPQGAFYV